MKKLKRFFRRVRRYLSELGNALRNKISFARKKIVKPVRKAYFVEISEDIYEKLPTVIKDLLDKQHIKILALEKEISKLRKERELEETIEKQIEEQLEYFRKVKRADSFYIRSKVKTPIKVVSALSNMRPFRLNGEEYPWLWGIVLRYHENYPYLSLILVDSYKKPTKFAELFLCPLSKISEVLYQEENLISYLRHGILPIYMTLDGRRMPKKERVQVIYEKEYLVKPEASNQKSNPGDDDKEYAPNGGMPKDTARKLKKIVESLVEVDLEEIEDPYLRELIVRLYEQMSRLYHAYTERTKEAQYYKQQVVDLMAENEALTTAVDEATNSLQAALNKVSQLTQILTNYQLNEADYQRHSAISDRMIKELAGELIKVHELFTKVMAKPERQLIKEEMKDMAEFTKDLQLDFLSNLPELKVRTESVLEQLKRKKEEGEKK